MRLSDAGLRRHESRRLCPNHRFPPWLSKTPTRDRSNRPLSDHSELFAKEFRSEVCAIWPDQRAQFRVQEDTPKLLNVAQRCKNRARQFTRKVNVTLSAITESNPNFKASNVMRFHYSRQHDNYSNGSIFGRDC